MTRSKLQFFTSPCLSKINWRIAVTTFSHRKAGPWERHGKPRKRYQTYGFNSKQVIVQTASKGRPAH
jgi:hypothetical protein